MGGVRGPEIQGRRERGTQEELRGLNVPMKEIL